jgi:hypothetical protein
MVDTLLLGRMIETPLVGLLIGAEVEHMVEGLGVAQRGRVIA